MKGIARPIAGLACVAAAIALAWCANEHAITFLFIGYWLLFAAPGSKQNEPR